MLEPLAPADARKLIRVIREVGRVAFSKHARDEMDKDALTTLDVDSVLRAGVVDPAEYERGSWRYRIRATRMTVVFAFRSEVELAIVTAWRNQSDGDTQRQIDEV